jgi:hypothetical protein
VHERVVNPSVLQRGSDVAGRMQCIHQPRSNARVEGINGRATPPPLDFGGVVRAARRVFGETFQRSRVVSLQPLALVGRPMLELDRVGDVKPVQKRSTVFRHSSDEIASRDRVAEPTDIAAHERRVHPEHRHPVEELVVTERAAQAVDSLRQRPASGFLVAVGPQPSEQLLATDAELAGNGQLREHGQSTTLHRGAVHRGTVAEKGDSSERSKFEHRTSIEV